MRFISLDAFDGKVTDKPRCLPDRPAVFFINEGDSLPELRLRIVNGVYVVKGQGLSQAYLTQEQCVSEVRKMGYKEVVQFTNCGEAINWIWN